jgi:hypothetical protein
MPVVTPVSVRLLGMLHTARRERGLPTHVEIDVPPEGKTALEIARYLELPISMIEAVFCNHVAHDLTHVIRPGDSIAFVSQGVPGPHRFTLGIHEAGRKSRELEGSSGED